MHKLIWLVGKTNGQGGWTFDSTDPSFPNRKKCQDFIKKKVIPYRKSVCPGQDDWHKHFRPIPMQF